MRLVSFDAFRTLGMPGIQHCKPEHMFRQKALIEDADWVLFPEYWQVNALIYGLKARIFPSPASYSLGHNKIEMTRVFEMLCPEHVPTTLILANSPDNRQRILSEMSFPFVAKEIKNSMGRGVFLIEGRADFEHYCHQVETLYVQEYLPIDRDMRLILMGDKVIAGYWRVAPALGFHTNIAQGGELLFAPVPEQAVQLVERVARTAGINHAGFDVAMIGNHCYLLEFNRLFGNSGIRELGLDLKRSMLQYLSREHLPPHNPPLLEATGNGPG